MFGAFAAGASDEATALRRAREFVVSVTAPGQPVARLKRAWRNPQGNIYVFDKGDGFVITSPSEGALPVLGYSDGGRFDIDSIPDALKELLALYEAELSCPDLRTGFRHEVEECRPVAPLLGSIAWDQNDPYNLLCPVYMGDTHSATGCVATAMAQIMRYHRWPERGAGSHSYTPTVNPAMGELSVDFSQSVYDWNVMLDRYGSTASEEARGAVARLMYDCGVAVNMEYGYMSGADEAYWPEALTAYFGYDRGVAFRRRAHYTSSEWEALIREELYAGRPVFTTGFTLSSGGHAFVFDGVDSNGLLHVNWGWSGMSNGYFSTTALTPSSQGTGGSIGGFNSRQVIITGIQPAVEGSSLTPELASAEALSARGSSDKSNPVKLRLNGVVRNVGWSDVTVDFAVEVVGNDGSPVMLLPGTRAVSVAKDGSCRNVTFDDADFSNLSDGIYTLRPVCRTTEESSWIPVRDLDPAFPNILEMVVEGSSLAFATVEPVTLTAEVKDVPSLIVSSQPTLIHVEVSNPGKSEYAGTLQAVICTPGGETVQIFDRVPVHVGPADTETVEFFCTLGNIDAGRYIVQIIDDTSHKLMSSGHEIEVLPFDKDAVVVAPSSPVVKDAEAVNPAMLEVSAEVECQEGIFTHQILLYIFRPGSDEPQGCLGPAFACLAAGDKGRLEFAGAFENAVPDSDYEVALVDGRSISYIKPRDVAKASFHVSPGAGVDGLTGDRARIVDIRDINGIKVNDMSERGLYVVRYSDGRIVKVLK